MTRIKLYNRTPNEIMDIVRELRAMGYQQGKDFDFAYHQASYNNDGYELIDHAHTIFSFHTEKYATLFAIKYSA